MTTMDIERKHASLQMGLPYRYATTRILGLTSILRELRSSRITEELFDPVFAEWKKKSSPAWLPCQNQIPEEDLNRFFQVDLFANNGFLLFLCFEIIFEGVVVFEEREGEPRDFACERQLCLPVSNALGPLGIVVFAQ